MPLMTPEQAAKAARDSAAARAAKNGTSSSQHTTFKGLVTARKSVASDQAAVQGSAVRHSKLRSLRRCADTLETHSGLCSFCLRLAHGHRPQHP